MYLVAACRDDRLTVRRIDDVLIRNDRGRACETCDSRGTPEICSIGAYCNESLQGIGRDVNIRGPTPASPDNRRRDKPADDLLPVLASSRARICIERPIPE